MSRVLVLYAHPSESRSNVNAPLARIARGIDGVTLVDLYAAYPRFKIDIEAEYVISVTWPDGSSDDIDTWIEDPSGNLTWFRNRSGGMVHLDRDDRGMLNDTLEVDGRQVSNPLNQEVAAVRGLLPGQYVVNVHYYDSASLQPVEVAVTVARVNPVYTVAWYGTLTLAEKGDEATAVRFTIAADGAVRDVNRLPKSLVP